MNHKYDGMNEYAVFGIYSIGGKAFLGYVETPGEGLSQVLDIVSGHGWTQREIKRICEFIVCRWKWITESTGCWVPLNDMIRRDVVLNRITEERREKQKSRKAPPTCNFTLR